MLNKIIAWFAVLVVGAGLMLAVLWVSPLKVVRYDGLHGYSYLIALFLLFLAVSFILPAGRKPPRR